MALFDIEKDKTDDAGRITNLVIMFKTTLLRAEDSGKQSNRMAALMGVGWMTLFHQLLRGRFFGFC
ncbi:hypothetical protein [Kaarinaea lacus]